MHVPSGLCLSVSRGNSIEGDGILRRDIGRSEEGSGTQFPPQFRRGAVLLLKEFEEISVVREDSELWHDVTNFRRGESCQFEE
jgi:hypothetical protein